MNKPNLGVVLLNLGTPNEPSATAIRRYLAEFLSDPRVVDLPRWIWLPILHLVILNLRPQKLVEKYQSIWGPKGAPLREYSEALAEATQDKIQKSLKTRKIIVRAAMTYGSPNIQHVIHDIERLGVKRFLFLPLFPQYSSATVGACFDKVARAFKDRVTVPPSRFLSGYHDNPGYIESLCRSIRNYEQDNFAKTLLLFSFHGIPQSQSSRGDPYQSQCEKTAKLVASKLELGDHQWKLSYQSRFGPAPWLKPYTDETLAALPSQGILKVLVVCPGFATDCLETLEEIDIENREIFLKAGGEAFRYVPALNASQDHINLIKDIILTHLYPMEQAREAQPSP